MEPLHQVMEKEMAIHSSVLAWRIPGTGEPGGLLSMGSHGVRHNWRDLAAAAAAVCCCIYVPHLFYPFHCQWMFRLLPCQGYCKLCCSEHWSACPFSNYGLLQIDIWPGLRLLDQMAVLFLLFSKTSILFVVSAPIYIHINSVVGFPFLHTLSGLYCLQIFWWWPFWLMWGDMTF